MSFPTQYNDAGMTEFEKLELEVRGKPLTLNVELANGKKEVIAVSTGQDVAYAKSLFAKKLNIQYSSVQLYLGTTLMIDPLSFNDFSQLANLTEVTIKAVIAKQYII